MGSHFEDGSNEVTFGGCLYQSAEFADLTTSSERSTPDGSRIIFFYGYEQVRGNRGFFFHLN